MSWMAIAAGAVKAVQGGMHRNSKVEASAMRYGTALANSEYKYSSTISAGQENAANALANANATENQITINEAETKANQEVANVVSGATGGSVERGIQEIESSAVKAQSANDMSLEAAQDRIEKQTMDQLTGVVSRQGAKPTAEASNLLLTGSLAGLNRAGQLGMFS
jgi:hypothetical protein